VLIDVNAYIGHWPFRELRHNTAAALVRLMDRKAIDVACVSNASAILYKNPQTANEELARQVRRHGDRLIPFAVINPTYADWEHDLAVCSEELGCRGLRLYPGYHNYDLADACCAELVSAATERGLPISIPIRATDRRQRHCLVDVPDVPLDAIASLEARHPKARFILLNGIGYPGSALGKPDNGLPRNYFIEISRLSAVLQSEIRRLIDVLGAGRLVFGTGMCFKYPDPPLLKLEVLEATRAQKERIRWRNAAKLLGLSRR
jgi:predicted TIM-barrel fold metal-dependent hydrolase